MNATASTLPSTPSPARPHHAPPCAVEPAAEVVAVKPPRVKTRDRGPMYLIVGLCFALAINLLIGVRLLLREPAAAAPANVELPREFKAALRDWLRGGGQVPPDRAVDARFALQAAQTIGGEALVVLDEVIEESRAWEANVTPLSSNDDGRGIAADREKVEVYVALAAKRPDGDRTAALQQEVQQLLLAAEAEWNAGGIQVTYGRAEQVYTALRAAHAQADGLLQDARKARQAILELVDPTVEPGEHDLAAAVLDAQRRWREEYALSLRQAQESVRRAAALRGANEVLVKGGLDQLKKEAVSPKVLAALKPFVTPSKILGEQVYSTPRRFALSELRRTNALDRSSHGYARLAWSAVATDLHPNPWKSLLVNGRVQAERWSPAQQEFVRQAQEYLIKYGPSLVELGLLEP